ncbi:MAG: response regulator [bacterium]|nr:response regulator [bacterium]
MNSDKVSILMVEDDAVDVKNVRRAFAKINCSNPLYVAQDGVEALEMLRERRDEFNIFPRLILLDLNMPRMNGIEFLTELRADPELQHMVVIVLTTSDDQRDIVSAYSLNVAGYIVKPVTFDLFANTMATLGMYWTLSELP